MTTQDRMKKYALWQKNGGALGDVITDLQAAMSALEVAKDGLEAIKKHQETVMQGNAMQISTTWFIANAKLSTINEIMGEK
jgi:hypothetical protein